MYITFTIFYYNTCTQYFCFHTLPCAGADPGFQARVWGTHKKIAPSGGRREICWGISCEKSRFYAKIFYFSQFKGGRAPGAPPLDPPLVWGRYCACQILIANPIDWLYAGCLEYVIFVSIDSSEARKQYDELSVNHANNNLCTWQNAFSRHWMDSSLWSKRMELIEVKSLICAQKGKLYITYENMMWILRILRFKFIHLLFYTFIHMYISNYSNVILKYFHFVLLVVFF